MTTGKESPQNILVARLTIVNDLNQILFLQRRPESKHNPLGWEVPGGTAEDVSPEINEALMRGNKEMRNRPAVHDKLGETALREVPAETGYEVCIEGVFVWVDPRDIIDGDKQGATYNMAIAKAKVTGGMFQRSDEHVDDTWLTYKDAEGSLDLTKETRQGLSRLYNMGWLPRQ